MSIAFPIQHDPRALLKQDMNLDAPVEEDHLQTLPCAMRAKNVRLDLPVQGFCYLSAHTLTYWCIRGVVEWIVQQSLYNPLNLTHTQTSDAPVSLVPSFAMLLHAHAALRLIFPERPDDRRRFDLFDWFTL